MNKHTCETCGQIWPSLVAEDVQAIYDISNVDAIDWLRRNQKWIAESMRERRWDAMKSMKAHADFSGFKKKKILMTTKTR